MQSILTTRGIERYDVVREPAWKSATVTACAWEAPGIFDDCQAIRAAERDRHWGTIVKSCREAVPALLRAAEIIETSWYELSPEQQNEAIKVRALIDEHAKREAAESRNFFDRLARTTKALWWGLHQTDIMPYMYACVRFMIAVDRAVGNESRRRRFMEQSMAKTPDLIAEIERGEADFSASRTTRYSREEFQQRFILT